MTPNPQSVCKWCQRPVTYSPYFGWLTKDDGISVCTKYNGKHEVDAVAEPASLNAPAGTEGQDGWVKVEDRLPVDQDGYVDVAIDTKAFQNYAEELPDVELMPVDVVNVLFLEAWAGKFITHWRNRPLHPSFSRMIPAAPAPAEPQGVQNKSRFSPCEYCDTQRECLAAWQCLSNSSDVRAGAVAEVTPKLEEIAAKVTAGLACPQYTKEVADILRPFITPASTQNLLKRYSEALKRLMEFLGYGHEFANEEEDTIEDGFGSVWHRRCPICKLRTMEVVRPGKVQCGFCDSRGFDGVVLLEEVMPPATENESLIRPTATGASLKTAGLASPATPTESVREQGSAKAARLITIVVDKWLEKMNLPTSNKEGKEIFTQTIQDIIEQCASPSVPLLDVERKIVAQPDPWVDVKVGLPEPSEEIYYEVLRAGDDHSFAYYSPSGAKRDGVQTDWCWFDREENGWCHKDRYTHWKLPTRPPETRATEGK